MNTEDKDNHIEKPVDEASQGAQDGAASADEFKITVRKLEMPVRPRGVLAE
jgi:hypothetical protein